MESESRKNFLGVGLRALGWFLGLMAAFASYVLVTARADLKSFAALLDTQIAAIEANEMEHYAIRCLYDDWAPNVKECGAIIFGSQEQTSRVRAYAERVLLLLRDSRIYDSIYCEPERFIGFRTTLARLEIEGLRQAPEAALFARELLWLSGNKDCRAGDSLDAISEYIASDQYGVWTHVIQQSFGLRVEGDAQIVFGLENLNFERGRSNAESVQTKKPD